MKKLNLEKEFVVQWALDLLNNLGLDIVTNAILRHEASQIGANAIVGAALGSIAEEIRAEQSEPIISSVASAVLAVLNKELLSNESESLFDSVLSILDSNLNLFVTVEVMQGRRIHRAENAARYYAYARYFEHASRKRKVPKTLACVCDQLSELLFAQGMQQGVEAAI